MSPRMAYWVPYPTYRNLAVRAVRAERAVRAVLAVPEIRTRTASTAVYSVPYRRKMRALQMRLGQVAMTLIVMINLLAFAPIPGHLADLEWPPFD